MDKKFFDILLSENVSEEINNNKEYFLEVVRVLKDAIGFDQNHPHHHLDLWDHIMMVLDNTEPDLELRLAALFHDVGKPFSFVIGKDNYKHYPFHAFVSMKIAKNFLWKYNFDEELTNNVLYLILNHDTAIDLEKIEDRELEIKRLKLQYADALAHHPDTIQKRIEHLDQIKKVLI